MPKQQFEVVSDTYEHYQGGARDCAVRALSVASGESYDVAYRTLAAHGRKSGGRTTLSTLDRACKDLGAVSASVAAALTRGARASKPTLSAFVRTYPHGRFVVTRSGHAFAVVNGKVHDWHNGRTGPRSRIQFAWFFEV